MHSKERWCSICNLETVGLQVGCIESRMIANGTKPGDVLAHCFTGGGHESTLHVSRLGKFDVITSDAAHFFEVV